MKEKMEYYLGLDMGTNSVGWAVTDKEYRLMRAKGKDLWGVRLFERANTAEERRAYRINRRRRQREVARIGILKELFADEIAKVDANFLHAWMTVNIILMIDRKIINRSMRYLLIKITRTKSILANIRQFFI